MYELADWGRPVPPDWIQERERVEARFPTDLVRRLRTHAHAHGMSLAEFMERLLDEAIEPEAPVVALSGDRDTRG